jgi:hypothetical protein
MSKQKHPWRDYDHSTARPVDYVPDPRHSETGHRTRQPGRHVDARALGTRVRSWLATHPGESAASLSRRARVGHDWVSKLRREEFVEVGLAPAQRLVRAMQHGEEADE